MTPTLSLASRPWALLALGVVTVAGCTRPPAPEPEPARLRCAPETRCLTVTPDGQPDPEGSSVAQCAGLYPDYIVPADFFPAGYAGPWFSLAQDFPREPPEGEDLPWEGIDFKAGQKDADAYLYALRDYAFEGMIEADFVPSDNPARPWFHVPLMNYHHGRELVRGVTEERPLGDGELGLKPGVVVRNFAVGFYNDIGAYTIGQVLSRPHDPDLDEAHFAEGAMVFKILFSAARPEHFVEPEKYILEGAPAWRVAVGERDETSGAAHLTTVRLLQMDVAVRDDRALPSGWVFGTFAFDRDAPDVPAWKRLRPVGLQWGNDPGYTPEDQEAGKPLEESIVSDEIPGYAAGHLGWAGRVNGPVDNPVSACMSCHQVAQYPPAADMGPFKDSCDTDARKLYWFRNLDKGQAFGAMDREACEPMETEDPPVSLDFSLQLAAAVQSVLSYNNVNPCQPPTAPLEGAPVSPAEEPRIER